MPKFKPGDRIVSLRWKSHGRVMEASANRLRILWDGDEYPLWCDPNLWQLDSASVVGSAEWLERRAYDAAFARE